MTASVSSPLPSSPLGQMITAGIKDLGCTVAEFAALVGVSRPTVYDWIRTLRPRPRDDQRQAIADAFGVDRAFVDEVVYVGLGYRLATMPPRAQYVARVLARLDEYDLREIEELALRRLLKYRRGRPHGHGAARNDPPAAAAGEGAHTPRARNVRPGAT